MSNSLILLTILRELNMYPCKLTKGWTGGALDRMWTRIRDRRWAGRIGFNLCSYDELLWLRFWLISIRDNIGTADDCCSCSIRFRFRFRFNGLWAFHAHSVPFMSNVMWKLHLIAKWLRLGGPHCIFGKLIFGKIITITIVATSGQILRLKCTKFYFYSVRPRPPSWI